jgi:hypothetical protein
MGAMHRKDRRMKDDASIDNIPAASYEPFLAGITSALDTARWQAARAVNTILTAAYWESGRQIMEFQCLPFREDIRDTVSDIGCGGKSAHSENLGQRRVVGCPQSTRRERRNDQRIISLPYVNSGGMMNWPVTE